MRFVLSAFLFSASIATIGCGQAPTPAPDSGSGGSGPTCSPGQAIDATDTCFNVGIVDCADVFRGDDGICRPTRDACAPGERPDIVAGCVAVGVKDCAPEHLGADGICRPRRDQCAPGQLPLPVSGCVSLDQPDGCGSGPFGNVPDDDGNIYVDATAPSGGDGTLQNPFQTIAQAMAVVKIGGRIVLAAGVYPEAVEITQPLEIRGRCASMTHIEGALEGNGVNAAIRIANAGSVALRDLSVSSPSRGIGLEGVQKTILERVRIHDTVEFGLYSSTVSGSLGMTRVLIEGTKAVASLPDEAFAGAIYLRGLLKAQIQSSAIVDNLAGSIIFDSGVDAEIRDSLIGDNQGITSGSVTDSALYVRYSTMNLIDSAVLRNRRLSIASAGSDTVIRNSVIADTRPHSTGDSWGYGVVAIEYGSLDFQSSILANNGEVAFVGDAGTKLTIEDSMIIDTQGTASTGHYGMGLGLTNVPMIMRRSTIAGNHALGLMLRGLGAKAELFETIIEGTLPQTSDQLFGRGIELSDEASISLSKVVLWKNHDGGIVLTAGSSAKIDDSYVGETLPRAANGEQGIGIFAASTTNLKLTRTFCEKNQVAAVVVSWATAQLTDVWVRSVLAGKFSLNGPDEVYEGVGDGIIATLNSTVDMSRVLVEDTARAGLLWDDSMGTMTNTLSRGNRFGIVFQGMLRPTYLPDSLVFTKNSEANQLDGGLLAVPAEPSKLP